MKLYTATLYRFGYDLTVIEKTEEKAKRAIIEAYIKAFIKMNGVHPNDEESERSWDGKTWLEDAIEDIEVTTLELGKVEWR